MLPRVTTEETENPAHPYAITIESAHLGLNAQVSLYPWKANPERIQLALRHIGTFLKANRLAVAVQPQIGRAHV